MAMGYYWALSRGLTHLKAAANPDVMPMLRGTGWEAIGPEFYHAQYDLRSVPLVLELAKLNKRFLGFIERQDVSHYLNSFEREFHSEGSSVVRAGDAAADAFVVVRGEAVVLGSDGRALARLGPGEVFGELALVTGAQRSATVIAGTDLDLMVLGREAFDAQLARDPAVAMKLLRLVAQRLSAATVPPQAMRAA
jgi:CRP-like cAMP-binding protein